MAKGLDNLNNLSWFLASLYPSYKDSLTATSISASPIFRVRNANLIASPTRDGQGILCVIKNVGVSHELKEGFISVNPISMGTPFSNTAADLLKNAGFENRVNEGAGFLIPKLFKISCTLDIVHDHALGWDHHTGQWRGGQNARSFPYSFGLMREGGGVPSANPPEVYEVGGVHALENEAVTNDLNGTAGMPLEGEGKNIP
jgi:hypothetical protein